MSSAAPYYQRSPRYVLRPGDRSLMRFAGMDTKGESTHARVRDLSSTGLSFIVEGDAVPFENELLKIEFDVPGHRQIAWYATVVRVEARSEWSPHAGDQMFTLVALRFRQLPSQFTQVIEQSVNGRINAEEEPLPAHADPAAVATLIGFGFALLFGFYWMSLPLIEWLKLVHA